MPGYSLNAYFHEAVLENKEDLSREKDKEDFLKEIYGKKSVYKNEDEFQKQIKDLVNKLKKYLPPTLKKLEDKCQAIINQFQQAGSLSSDIQNQLCKVGKRDLETFVYEAAKTSDTLLVESAFLTLTENLACTIGFLGDLEKAVGQILGGCNAILREARVKFVENEAQKFLFLKKPQEAKDFPGDHVHYIRDLTNSIAGKFYIPFVKEVTKFTMLEKLEFEKAFFGKNNFIEEFNSALVSILNEKMSAVRDEDTQNKFLKRLQNLGRLHPSQEEYDKQTFFTELKPSEEKEIKEKEVKEKEIKETAESPTITLKKEATDHLRSSIMQRLVESNAIKKGVYQRLPFSSRKETINVIYLDHDSDEKKQKEILASSAEAVYLFEQEKVLVYHYASTQKPTAINFKKQFPNIKTAYIIHDNRLYFYRQPNTCIQTNLINELGEGEHKKFFQKILQKTTTTDNKDIKKVDISNKDLYKLIKCTALGPSPKIYYLQKKNPDRRHSLAISKEDFCSFVAEDKIADKTHVSAWLIEKAGHHMEREIVFFPDDLKSSYVLFQNKRYLLSDQNWQDLEADQREQLLTYLGIPYQREESNFIFETEDILEISSYALAYLLKNKLVLMADLEAKFLNAIKQGNKKIVEILLVYFDLNQPMNGVNLLQLAAANNQTKMISLLVSKGADFREGLVAAAAAHDEKSFTLLKKETANTPEKILAAFMFAAEIKEYKGLPLVQRLIDQGFDAEDRFFQAIIHGKVSAVKTLSMLFDLNNPISKVNVLHLAAFNGQKEVVKVLIDKKANVQAGLLSIAEDMNDKDRKGLKIILEEANFDDITSTICYAVKKNKIAVLKTLLENIKNETIVSAIFIAIKENDTDSLETLLENVNGEIIVFAILDIAKRNDTTSLKTLLENVNDEIIRFTFLDIAKKKERLALTELIKVASPNKILTVLKKKEQCKEVVDILVECGIDIDSFLWQAVWDRKPTDLELLLDIFSGHYDLNQEIRNTLLLYLAASRNDKKTMKILIDNGSDFKEGLFAAAAANDEKSFTLLKNEVANTPEKILAAFMFAAEMKEYKGLPLVQKLIDQGFDAEDTFFQAVMHGKVAAVKTLSTLFDLNRPISNINLLHLAAFNQQEEIVKVLIDKKANVQTGLLHIATDKSDEDHKGLKLILEEATLEVIKSAIFEVIKKNEIAILKTLLENVENEIIAFAILEAVEKNEIAALKTLLENVKDEIVVFAILVVVEENEITTLKTLLDNVNDEIIKFTFLDIAKKKEWLSLKVLIKAASLDQIHTILFLAAKEKEQCKEVVDILAECATDIDCLLWQAVWDNKAADLKFLLEILSGHYNLNQEVRDTLLLYFAACQNDTEIMRILISNGADLQIAILKAAKNNNPSALKKLMEIAEPSKIQSTMLMAAEEKMINCFIQCSVDINLIVSQAVKEGNEKIVAALIDYCSLGLDEMNDLIYLAACSENAAIVKLLRVFDYNPLLSRALEQGEVKAINTLISFCHLPKGVLTKLFISAVKDGRFEVAKILYNNRAFSSQDSNYLRILDQKRCVPTVRNIKLAAILSIEKYRQGISSTTLVYKRSELLLNKILSCGSEASICKLINDFLLNGKIVYTQSDSLKFFNKVKRTNKDFKIILASTLKSLISLSDASSESLKVLMKNVHQVLNPQEPQKTSLRIFQLS